MTLGLAERRDVGEMQRYLGSVTERIKQMENELYTLNGAEHERTLKLERLQGALQQEVVKLNQDLDDAERELTRYMRQTQRLVGEFRNAMRQQQLENLRDRVDGWKGEEFITRAEFLKWLRQSERDA